MPILEDDDLDDRCLYWEYAGDGPDGQPVYEEPAELLVDWRVRHRETLAADGTQLAIDAEVTVDRVIPLGSKLWLAPDPAEEALPQWYGSGSAGPADEVMRVAARRRTRDTRGNEVRHVVELEWFRDA
jgi:hypothetical protein